MEYAQEYLQTGEEHLTTAIGLRAQWLAPTSADVKALTKLIDDLAHKEERETVLLNTRECVLLGAAYEYKLCIAKDPAKALIWYQLGSERVNTNVSLVISNRDRGHSLANACSLYDDSKSKELAKAFECGKQAAELGSQFGYAHLGHLYAVKRNLTKSKECLMKAPNIFFGHGILACLLRSEGKLDKAKFHWENAVSLGCVNSLKELIQFYEADPAKKMLITYEYATRLGHYTTQEMVEESKAARAAFNKLAQDHPNLIEERMVSTPWERIAPLLTPEVATWFAHRNSFIIATYYFELIKNLPVDAVTEMVIQYIFLPEYLDEAKAPVKRNMYFMFWEKDEESRKVKSARHRRNSDPCGVSEEELEEIRGSLQGLGLSR